MTISIGGSGDASYSSAILPKELFTGISKISLSVTKTYSTGGYVYMGGKNYGTGQTDVAVSSLVFSGGGITVGTGGALVYITFHAL